jgi:hypothetical protein
MHNVYFTELYCYDTSKQHSKTFKNLGLNVEKYKYKIMQTNEVLYKNIMRFTKIKLTQGL